MNKIECIKKYKLLIEEINKLVEDFTEIPCVYRYVVHDEYYLCDNKSHIYQKAITQVCSLSLCPLNTIRENEHDKEND